MKSEVALLAILMLIVIVGCSQVGSADLGEPYTATEIVQAHAESPSDFEDAWIGSRINVAGVVDRIEDGVVYLVADDYEDTVALDDLSRDERRMWESGDEVEYACEVGEYDDGSVIVFECGPPEHGAAASGILGNAGPILEYWSLPALLIVSVLTVTAMARSTWRGWQPPMIAVMCLGVLAILNAAATVVFGYTTVNSTVLTPIAAVSFVVILFLSWMILDAERFPGNSGTPPRTAVTPVPPSPVTVQPVPPLASSPDVTNVSDIQATAVASLGSPSAAAPSPSQTMAMQPDVASSMAWLVVTRGPSEGKSLQLKEGNNTIGRSLENDLQLDDASVSRSHAMVSVKDEEFTLVDLGSAGGTRIGDHRIAGRQIGEGSAIIVGQTRMSLMTVDAFQGGPSSGATMVGSPTGSSLSLIAQSGPDAGKSFLLSSAQNLIGRDSSAQVMLSDPTVSRRHAMIRVDADRTTISDLGSQSGTQVDGERIQGVRVSVGERVVVGQSEFTLMRPNS
ncbi:MAG: FHA domain-containing protein [Dehalococcoidia bacterium]|nr:FHA domain-containing protein [Dehalococcoidia bacterium]